MNLTALGQRLSHRFAQQPAMTPIGVDFASERLTLLQLQPTAGAARLQAVASLAYPVAREIVFDDPTRLRALVRTALAASPFVGRRIYATLPPDAVRILPLTVQVGGGQSEAQAVSKAVREHLGTDVTQAVVDYCHVRSVEAEGAERQVLVAVARQDTVVTYLNRLRAAGLQPVALDIGPAAIARLLAALHREDFDQSVVLINFGIEKSFLTVVWGRRLLLDREIDFCESQLVSKLAATLGLTLPIAQALLREHGVGGSERMAYAPGVTHSDIGQTLREILHPEFALLAEELTRTQVYVASRTRGSLVSQLYLNGSVARYPNMQSRLRELVSLPVDLLEPLRAFDTVPAMTAAIDPDAPLALAAGLALRGR